MTVGRIPSVEGGIQPTIVDAKGDLIVATAADTVGRIAVGSNGQVLVADSTANTGLKWAVDPTTDVVTTAGDLIYGTAADTVARLGIGTAGQVLKVNSGATAPEWGAAASGATFSGCSLRTSVDIAVANTTTVTVNWNTEDFDVDGYHDTSSNTSRITIPSGKTGYFLLVFSLRYQNNATGYRNLNLIKNGSSYKQMSISANEGGDATTIMGSQMVYAVPGDYFQITAFQNSGSSLELGGSTFPNNNFGITYLGA